MNKIVFILILNCLLFENIFAQSYKQMLDHDSEWHLTVCNNGCITDIYFTDGDTLYNNYNYKILNGYHYISKTFWLREDVISERVYLSFIQNSNRKEVLLYDFNLQKGDSININNPISPFVSNPGLYLVDSITNKQLNDGLYYDHFYLSPLSSQINESAVWIEGVGSLSLINAPGGTPNVNGSGKLSCYFNDGNLIYSQLDSISACVYTNPNLNSFNMQQIDESAILFYSDLLGRKIKFSTNKLIITHYENGLAEKKVYLD